MKEKNICLEHYKTSKHEKGLILTGKSFDILLLVFLHKLGYPRKSIFFKLTFVDICYGNLRLFMLYSFLACQCHHHSETCHYNETLGHGVCDSCKDGTTGMFCDECDKFFYPNSSLPITNEKACIGE